MLERGENPSGRMESRLKLDILPQPDDTTCGPTCLHAVYRYYGEEVPLPQVIEEVRKLDEGGTLATLLGIHALKRGYEATLYTLNLHVMDPTWFLPDSEPLAERLELQAAAKPWPKLQLATEAYLEFLELGGQIYMEDFTTALIRKYLKRSIPILTGLSATYLYGSAREYGPKFEPDDIRGVPAGHFVVLTGYHAETREVLVADPFLPNPLAPGHNYLMDIDRVISAILLGILTYDANMLIIEPRTQHKGKRRADSDRRE